MITETTQHNNNDKQEIIIIIIVITNRAPRQKRHTCPYEHVNTTIHVSNVRVQLLLHSAHKAVTGHNG